MNISVITSGRSSGSAFSSIQKLTARLPNDAAQAYAMSILAANNLQENAARAAKYGTADLQSLTKTNFSVKSVTSPKSLDLTLKNYSNTRDFYAGKKINSEPASDFKSIFDAAKKALENKLK